MTGTEKKIGAGQGRCRAPASVGEEAVLYREQTMQILGRKAFQAERTASAKALGQGVFEDQPGSQYGQSSKSKERYRGQKRQSLTGHYKKVTLTSHKVEETLAWF